MLFLLIGNCYSAISENYGDANQPSRGVLRKRCSENIQQIYRRTPIRSLISMKMQNYFIEITLRHWCSSVNFLYNFRISFPENTTAQLLLDANKLFIVTITSRIFSKAITSSRSDF